MYVECGVGCATVGVRATLMLTGWVPDNELGAQGAAALAGALGKLVSLTSLNLAGTWNVEWTSLCVNGVWSVWWICGCRTACVAR